MSAPSPDVVRRLIARLEDGERLSVLVGNDARPDELVMAAGPSRPLRRALIADLRRQLPPHPEPAAEALSAAVWTGRPQGQLRAADGSLLSPLDADADVAEGARPNGRRGACRAPSGAPRDSAETSARTE